MNIHRLALQIPSPIQSIELHGRRVWVKRDDLIHPQISGNKWRKLENNILEFLDKGYSTLITFGGVFSNHLYATAAACEGLGIKSVAIVRGEYHDANPTIQFLLEKKMDLHFWSRSDYRLKDKAKPFRDLMTRYAKPFVISEGGNSHLALPGIANMIKEIELQMPATKKCFVMSAGTGTTASGTLAVMKAQDSCIVIPVLKHQSIEKAILKLAPSSTSKNWQIYHDYHFGGYAKVTPQLMDFKHEFESKHKIPLDPIYTVKMFYAIQDLIQNNKLDLESEIVAIHTGGLQGNDGFKYLQHQ